MTNLESNKERIRDGMAFCTIAYLCRYGEQCSHKLCSNCEFNENVDECIKAVLAERKEPIKLKQWEKDFIISCTESYAYEEKDRVINYWTLKSMIKKGHFKGIVDTSMTLKEILDNCEIVD